MNQETILWTLQLIIWSLRQAQKRAEKYKDDFLSPRLEKIEEDLWGLQIDIEKVEFEILEASKNIGLAEMETWAYVNVDLEDIIKRIK